MVFNTKYKTGADNALNELKQLIKLEKVVEIKVKQQTRTSQQNRALHLFFKLVSEELNNLGISFVYIGLKGMELETEWTPELFKNFTWKPIQKAMFGSDSTTKLKRKEIDPIVNTICNFFAEKGVEIDFPNNFDYYLKFYEHE